MKQSIDIFLPNVLWSVILIVGDRTYKISKEVKAMAFLEKLFCYDDRTDGIYERRKARGEVQDIATTHISLRQQVEEQKKIVRDLVQENNRLRKELNDAYEQLKRNDFIHSMDDLIEAMKDKPKDNDCLYNPFAAYMRNAHSSTSSGSSADSSVYGNAFEPEQCDVPDDAEYGDEDTDIDIDDEGDER